jgi:very-short-patch-repair endonuclease
MFHTNRGWRFDFWFPEAKLAVEIEGGTHNNGAHNRAKGYEKDCTKYNAAAMMGIFVLRYTTDQVVSAEAIDQTMEFLAKK